MATNTSVDTLLYNRVFFHYICDILLGISANHFNINNNEVGNKYFIHPIPLLLLSLKSFWKATINVRCANRFADGRRYHPGWDGLSYTTSYPTMPSMNK